MALEKVRPAGRRLSLTNLRPSPDGYGGARGLDVSVFSLCRDQLVQYQMRDRLLGAVIFDSDSLNAATKHLRV